MRYFLKAVELDGKFAGQSQEPGTPEQGGKAKKLIACAIGVRTYGREEIIKRIKQIIPGQTDEFYEKFIEAYNNSVCAIIEEGNAVRTDLFYATPSVQGTATESMLDGAMPFRPKVNLRPGESMQKAVKKVHLVRDTQHKSGAFISSVYAADSKSPGSVIKPGKMLTLKGSGLKIVGEDPTVGIYFKSLITGALMKVPASDMGSSTKSKVLLQVPANLEPGQYLVQVVTQYVGAKKPRIPPLTITYEDPLTVE